MIGLTMRDLFLKDWAWKLFSVFLAVAIWLTVHRILLESGKLSGADTGESRVTYGNLPVDLVSAEADVRDYRLLQTAVTVTVSGAPELIGTLQANQIHATVNITGAAALNTEKQHVDVSVPLGITVVSVRPESIGVIAPPTKN